MMQRKWHVWLGTWVTCLALVACGDLARRQQDAGATSAPTTGMPSADTDESPRIMVMLSEPMPPHFRADDTYGESYDTGHEPPDSRARIRTINQAYGLRQLAQWPMPDIRVRCYVEAIAPGQDMATVLKRLSQDPRVESAQALNTFRTLSHDDRYYPLQSNVKALHLDRLHRMATGRGIKVAVIDTDIDAKHPDLIGQVADQQDFTGQPLGAPEAHGTEVGGLIAALADNQVGIVGVAPDVHLTSLRACWQAPSPSTEAFCNSFTLAKAIQYALMHGVRIINMSLTGPPDALLERLIKQTQKRGMLVVAALDIDAPERSFPASLPDVIGVACCDARASPVSTTSSSSLSSPSINASHTWIHVPATRVLTTLPNASWGFVTGSSFACAQFTGLAALLMQLSPDSSPAQIRQLITRFSTAWVPHTDALSVDIDKALRSLYMSNDPTTATLAAQR